MKFKNWDELQHYHKRKGKLVKNPSWIKLYKKLLDDPDYHKLSDKAGKYFPLALLIASENLGELPPCKDLAFRLRVQESEAQGFIQEWTPFLAEGLDMVYKESRHDLAQIRLDKIREDTISNPFMCRLNKLFRRRDATKWSDKELKALSAIEFVEDDISVLEAYYTASFPKDKDYRRRDMATLLNNWNGEVDRARAWKLKQSEKPKLHI